LVILATPRTRHVYGHRKDLLGCRPAKLERFCYVHQRDRVRRKRNVLGEVSCRQQTQQRILRSVRSQSTRCVRAKRVLTKRDVKSKLRLLFMLSEVEMERGCFGAAQGSFWHFRILPLS